MAFATKHRKSSSTGKKVPMMNNQGQADVSPSNNHTVQIQDNETQSACKQNKLCEANAKHEHQKKRKTDYQCNALFTTDKTTLPNQYALTKKKYVHVLNTATNSIHFLKPSSSEVDSCQQTCTRKFSISTRT